MKAITIDTTKTGVDKFIMKEIETPSPQKGEVLVKVKAVPLSSGERDVAKNDDALSLSKQVKKRLEFSGIVYSDGEHFKKGDRVFGTVNLFKDEKSMSEYIAVKERYIAHLPTTLSFAEGAALPVSAQTALKALQLAALKKGMSILILGANGGVGVYATQLSKTLGAQVTAIGNSSYLNKLHELGANQTYDYKKVTYKTLNKTYDVIFDLSNTLKFKEVKMYLKDRGVFLNPNPHHDLIALLSSRFTNKKTPFFIISHVNTSDLNKLVTLVSEGKIKPVVEKIYNLSEYKDAFQELMSKPRFGKIIIEF